MHVNWTNIVVTGISGIRVDMPEVAKVSIFMDNDLTHITDDHFEVKLFARLLNQIYVIPPPILPLTFTSYPLIGRRYGYTLRIFALR